MGACLGYMIGTALTATGGVVSAGFVLVMSIIVFVFWIAGRVSQEFWF
jgi:hypothetical protein